MMTRLEFDKSFYLNPKMQPLGGTSLTNLLRLLAWNRFSVDWRFIPRLLYVSLLVTIFSPLRIYEKIKFDKKIKETEIPQIICIVGHFRSGTTFLQYLMGQDRNLSFVSTRETMTPWIILSFDKLLDNIVDQHLPDKRPMDDLEMRSRLPYEDEYAIANLSPYSFYHGWYFPKNIYHYFRRYVLFDGVDNDTKERWKEIYRYLLKKIAYKYGGKLILLKSLVNTARIKLLLETFPNIKFIHIYRNPYHVYLSTWRLYNSIIPIFSLQMVDREFLDKFIIDFYKELYKRYLREKESVDENNLVEIRYEDFVKSPVKTLKEVYDKLGLGWFEDAKPYFERFLSKYKDYKPHRYEIDEETRRKIGKEWDFAFKAFGYEK